jgi:hypothetical protein
MYDDAGSCADDGPEPGGGLGRLGHDTRRTDGSPAHRCVPNIRIFSFLDSLETLVLSAMLRIGEVTPNLGSWIPVIPEIPGP